MKPKILTIALLFPVLFAVSAQDRVLVFTKTNGFPHSEAINAGIDMITDLGNENGLWDTDETADADEFTTENLAQYSAVIWLNTSGDGLLNDDQQEAFEDFITNGGGYLGIHAATDTYRDRSWPFYNELVGGIVQSQPNHTRNNFNADMTVVSSHPSVDFIGDVGAIWNKSEEYYYWRDNGGQLSDHNINLLMVESNGNEEFDEPRPIAWVKDFGGGRSFYTALGHNSSDYTDDDNFIKHIEEGIKFVIGNNVLSVSGPEEQLSVQVSPNPVSDVFRFDSANTIHPKMIKIYDIDGQLVYQKEIASDEKSAEILVGYLSNGLYIGKVQSGDLQSNFKFIKN